MEYTMTGYSGCAVKFSTYRNDKLAVAASKNFGLVGNGAVFVLGLGPDGIQAERVYPTQDAVYDISHSETNETQIIAGCGDGSVLLFDTNIPDHPIATWREHGREVFSTAYNTVTKDTFVTASWDSTMKVWNAEQQNSLMTIPTHTCTYSAAFSPHHASLISCVSADSHLRLFDLRTPASASNHLVKLIPVHGSGSSRGARYGSSPAPTYAPAEVLAHDWNKYRDTAIAVGGVDTLIRIFDLRNDRIPVSTLEGHEYAVRGLSYSPHLSDVLLSASYDMSVRVWADGTLDVDLGAAPPDGQSARGHLMGRFDRHTEFCTSVDWCMFGNQGWAASTAWDGRVCVFDVRNTMLRQ